MFVIGAGPAGLTAAIYCGRAGLAPLVATGGSHGWSIPGGQLMTTTEVENFPGFPDGVKGPELVANMTEQAKKCGAIFVDSSVAALDVNGVSFRAVFEGGKTIETESVIIASGASAKRLELPGSSRLLNRGISSCATCDGPLKVFRGKHLFVVGGGDSAMEEALFLTRFASKVTIVHRRDTFRASKVMIDRVLRHDKIDVIWSTEVVGVEGEDFLTGLHLKAADGTSHYVAASGLFVAIGHHPNTEFLLDSGVNLTKNGYVEVHNHVNTSVDGIFAAGDIHDEHFRQAITAAGFGCMAALACERWLSAKESKL